VVGKESWRWKGSLTEIEKKKENSSGPKYIQRCIVSVFGPNIHAFPKMDSHIFILNTENTM
jgi:hypothetical protein